MGTRYSFEHMCDVDGCNATRVEGNLAWYPGAKLRVPDVNNPEMGAYQFPSSLASSTGRPRYYDLRWRWVETDLGVELICPRHVVTIKERKPE